MKRRASIVVLVAAGLLAGCASSTNTVPTSATASNAGATGTTTAAGTTPGATSACSGGLTGSEPGVVSITCNGTAEIKINAGGVAKDMHGGQCRTAGDVWSAAVGVIIDATGTTGKYTGPPVDSIVVNNTSTPGKATIQASLSGKLYYDLGEAKLTLSADRKTAHIVGVSERTSDAPNAPITVDVTC